MVVLTLPYLNTKMKWLAVQIPHLEARVAQAVRALCLSQPKPSQVCTCDVSRERVTAVDLPCASRIYLRVLQFSSSLISTQIGHLKATSLSVFILLPRATLINKDAYLK